MAFFRDVFRLAPVRQIRSLEGDSHQQAAGAWVRSRDVVLPSVAHLQQRSPFCPPPVPRRPINLCDLATGSRTMGLPAP